ncbi:MAG: hypothetical protein WC492_01430 [Candidatus Micrarchaeia archaeon]
MFKDMIGKRIEKNTGGNSVSGTGNAIERIARKNFETPRVIPVGYPKPEQKKDYKPKGVFC